MKEENKTITTYSIQCPVCDKKITGYKPSQVDYNLKIHMDAKHEVKE